MADEVRFEDVRSGDVIRELFGNIVIIGTEIPDLSDIPLYSRDALDYTEKGILAYSDSEEYERPGAFVRLNEYIWFENCYALYEKMSTTRNKDLTLRLLNSARVGLEDKEFLGRRDHVWTKYLNLAQAANDIDRLIADVKGIVTEKPFGVLEWEPPVWKVRKQEGVFSAMKKVILAEMGSMGAEKVLMGPIVDKYVRDGAKFSVEGLKKDIWNQLYEK
ncbi:hypothetical protein HNV12_01235 [Methanococcoides sp. SA1]|nr:hypothetical protein [Methanococcoides sp. SA1]